MVLRNVVTYVHVFLLWDMHRNKGLQREMAGIPIYYGFVGKKLPMSAVRQLSDHLISTCKSTGIAIVTRGIDGQISPTTILFPDQYNHIGNYTSDVFSPYSVRLCCNWHLVNNINSPDTIKAIMSPRSPKS